MDASPSRRARLRWSETLALLVLASAVRFDGIDWGRPFSYHPDEHAILHAALNMVREGDPNPHWFRYPSLVLYLEALLVWFLKHWVAADLRTAPEAHGLGPWDIAPQQFPFLLAGRMAVAAFGVASVGVVARTAARFTGPVPALLAAALLALAPLHVESSHYLTTDVPAMFWVALTLRFSLASDSSRKWLLAGAAAGLAAASKYPAGMVLGVPLGLALVAYRWRSAVAVLVASALAFSLASPFVWLDLPAFLSDVEAQRAHYASGLSAAGNWWRYLLSLALHGYGALPLLLAAAGVLRCGLRGPLASRELLVLVGVPTLYFAYLSAWPLRFDRNLMPLLPFLCWFVALALAELPLARTAQPKALRLSVSALLIAAVLAQPAYSTWQLRARWHALDTRSEAYAWVETHLPAGTHLVREEYTPQIASGKYRVTFVQVAGSRPYSWYLQNEVDYLVLSSDIYGRFHAARPEERAIAEFYRFVFTSLPLAAEFVPGPGRVGPTIRVYEIPRWREEPASQDKDS